MTNQTRMDEPTLATLIRDYSAPLLRYVTTLTFNDRKLAEDIVQETFIRTWQRPQVLRSAHSTIGPWLFTVARNLVNDHRRARARRPADLAGSDLAHVPDPRDPNEETLLAHDIHRAMAGLTAHHRAILIQVYRHDRSFEDAARRLAIPVGTAKSRTHYALRSLRSIFQALDIHS